MAEPEETLRCAACDAWHLVHTTAGGTSNQGECRRRSPTVNRDGNKWPKTWDTDWCLEHSHSLAPEVSDLENVLAAIVGIAGGGRQ